MGHLTFNFLLTLVPAKARYGRQVICRPFLFSLFAENFANGFWHHLSACKRPIRNPGKGQKNRKNEQVETKPRCQSNQSQVKASDETSDQIVQPYSKRRKRDETAKFGNAARLCPTIPQVHGPLLSFGLFGLQALL